MGVKSSKKGRDAVSFIFIFIFIFEFALNAPTSRSFSFVYGCERGPQLIVRKSFWSELVETIGSRDDVEKLKVKYFVNRKI